MDAAVSQTAAAPMRDQRSDLSALLACMPEKETKEISLRKENIDIDCARSDGINIRRDEMNKGKPAEPYSAIGS